MKNRGEKGIALISSVLIMMIFLAIGAVFIGLMSTDLKVASNQKRSLQALWVAEAGLQRAIYELDQDFENTLSWADGISGDPPSGNFSTFLSDGAAGGIYTIQFKNVSSNDAGTLWWRDRIVVRVTGKMKGAKRVIEANLSVERSGQGVDPGAVFSGSPLNGGGLIVGNVTFRGSLYIKGCATLDALVLSGNAGVFNNYEEDGVLGSDISAYLKARIPEIYDSEIGMDSLDARVYIHNGDLNLGGNSYFGKNQVLLTDRQPLNGVYVGGTTTGGNHVHADVKELNGADVPDIPFPGMLDWFEVNDDPNDVSHYRGLYPAYSDTELAMKMYEDAAGDLDYYSGASDGLEGIYLAPDVLDDMDVALNDGSNPPFYDMGLGNYKLIIDKDTRSFSVTQGSHKIEWDSVTRVLTFTGSPLVYVAGHDDPMDNALELANAEGSIANNKIEFAGKVTLLADGNIDMGKGVAAYDNGTGQHAFPHQSMLSVLTPDKILFSGSNDADFTGYFYAETEIHFSKQVKIAGALVSNLITYANAPDVYEVPELVYVLPAGVPGGPGSGGGGGGSGSDSWSVVFRTVEGEVQPWREVY